MIKRILNFKVIISISKVLTKSAKIVVFSFDKTHQISPIKLTQHSIRSIEGKSILADTVVVKLFNSNRVETTTKNKIASI